MHRDNDIDAGIFLLNYFRGNVIHCTRLATRSGSADEDLCSQLIEALIVHTKRFEWQEKPVKKKENSREGCPHTHLEN